MGDDDPGMAVTFGSPRRHRSALIAPVVVDGADAAAIATARTAPVPAAFEVWARGRGE